MQQKADMILSTNIALNSFNEPIVEQLHGVNPNDPKYGPPLLSLGYSALVTGYRLLSYTLLSVLIAAWAGYFRKKNQ